MKEIRKKCYTRLNYPEIGGWVGQASTGTGNNWQSRIKSGVHCRSVLIFVQKGW